MPTELFNFPFAARLDQSKDAKQLDVGFQQLTNVAFDADGALTKRPGLSLAWNGTTDAYDSPDRLMPVGKTLAMLGGATPTSVENDSQMGNVSLYSDKLDSWAGSGDWIQWVSPMWVEREDIASQLDSSLVDGDVAYCNGYIVQAWIRDGISSTADEWEVVVRVIDAETGTVRGERIYDAKSGANLPLTALKCTKAATVNIVMVTWINKTSSDPSNKDLRRALINLTSTAPTFGVAGDLVLDVRDYYDVAFGPVAANDQQWIVGVEVTPNDVLFAGYNSAATLVHTYATTEDKNRPSVTTLGGTDVAIAWYDTTTDLEVRRYSQTVLVANTPIENAVAAGVLANVFDTSIVHIPSHGTNDCLVSWSYAVSSPTNHVLNWARTNHDGVGPIGAISKVRRLRLYSHMRYLAERVYVCVADGEDGGATWPSLDQRRVHWVNLPIATGAASTAFRPIPVASSQLGLPSTIFSRPGVLRSLVQDTGSAEVVRHYQAVVTMHPAVGTPSSAFVQSQQMAILHFPGLGADIARSDLGRAVKLGGQTYVASGTISQFDDVRFFENGFLQAPGFSVAKVDTPGGASVTDGTYDIKVVYEFLDDSDQLAFSLECGPLPVTTDGGNADAVDVTIEPLTLTLKQQKFYNSRKVRLGVYVRTGNNPYRRWLDYSAATFDVDEINDPTSLTARVLRFTTPPNATAPLLYTDGLRLPTDVIPSCTALCAHKGRLWAAGGEFGGVIYYSLEWREGEPLSFNLAQFLNIPEARIVALISIDEILYAFSSEGIWAIFGDGPNDTGSDGGFQVQRITSDVGMQWPRCWAIGRDGVYFVGRKGFYLLTRKQTVQYIGGPVESLFGGAFDFRAAVVVDSRHEVRFYTQSSSGVNSAIVLDYETGAWASWVYIPAADGVSVDAVLWNGVPTLLTTGDDGVAIGKVYQDGSEYRDAGTFYAMSAQTGEVRFGRPLELKKFQRCSLLFNRNSGNGGIRISVIVPGTLLSAHANEWSDTVLDAAATRDRVRMQIRDQKFLAWRITVSELEPTAVPVFTSAMTWSALAFEVRSVGKLGRASDTMAR